ncbi:MAG TPA: hypothetical protein VD838_04435 [Anaeromyxobacteraceae bacterium]|nr:hypothetical protein [Anaeromyxobacteraceae bacterium]
MRLVRIASLSALLLAPAVATPRAWQGIQPGQSPQAQVTERFGEPTTRAKRGARTVLAYLGEQAPSGTRQAQFHVGDDGIVHEVTVFVATELDKDAIEGTYGKSPEKTFTDEFLPVWLYRAAGVTVYFGKAGTVEAITFTAGAAGRGATPAPRADPTQAAAGASAAKPAAAGARAP